MFKLLFNCISSYINQNKPVKYTTKHLTSKQIRRLKRRTKYLRKQ